MSVHSSKRSSICTIRSKSTHRSSSSNLALIQEQVTPPAASPILDRAVDSATERRQPKASDAAASAAEDTTPLNPAGGDDDEGEGRGGGSEGGTGGGGERTVTEMEEGRKEESDEKEKKSGKDGGWVQQARVVFIHVGMVVLCVLYALAGATIFYVIEQPEEHRIRDNNLRTLRHTRNTILRELWTMSADPYVTQDQFRQAAYEKSDEFVKVLFESLDEGGYMSPAAMKDLLSVSTILNDHDHDEASKKNTQLRKGFSAEEEIDSVVVQATKSAPLPDMWSFLGAVFFATATLTTVGYGHTAPVTTLGRLLCVAFGLLGIPLTLMTITDIGKFLGEGLKRMYRRWVRCRKLARTKVGNCFKKNQPVYQLQTQEDESTSAGAKNEQPPAKNITSTPDKEQKVGETKSTKGNNDEENNNTNDNNNGKTTTEAKAAEELAADVSTSLPVKWIFLLFVGYTIMGASLFTRIEPWSLLESFYFCFITMTTIGYGDFVPLNQSYFALTLLYIVLGLAITTMSIDQAGSEYIKKVHYFGRKIQSAKQVLSNVRNMITYANWVKRRYGLTDQQFRQIACLPGFMGMQAEHTNAFMPACYRRLYWIDQNMLEEIFTITTLESEQELDALAADVTTSETEFLTRHEAAMAGSNGQIALFQQQHQQHRERVGSAWSRARRRCFEQRRLASNSRGSIGPSFSCINFPSPQHTPTSMTSQRDLSYLERIAATQRMRQTEGGVRKPFDRTVSGTGLLEASTTRGSINNNYSPKLVSSNPARGSELAVINRQVTPVPTDIDGSLISL